MDWLRRNNPPLEEVDQPTLEALSNLTGLPLPKNVAPEDKKKHLDENIDWLRRNSPDMSDLDNPTVEKVKALEFPRGILAYTFVESPGALH